MKIVVLEDFVCPKCDKRVNAGQEAWLEELGTGFCAEFFDLMCEACGKIYGTA